MQIIIYIIVYLLLLQVKHIIKTMLYNNHWQRTYFRNDNTFISFFRYLQILSMNQDKYAFVWEKHVLGLRSRVE